MNEYIVELVATHPTRRRIFVQADSEEEAERKALADNEEPWELDSQMPETDPQVNSVELQ